MNDKFFTIENLALKLSH